MYNRKNDSLVDSVKAVMEQNELHRRVEAAVNEHFGIATRKALPHELHDEYDAILAEAKKCAMEELKGDQHKIDANKNKKIDAHDFKLLRAKKKMSMEEESEQLDEKAKSEQQQKFFGLVRAIQKGKAHGSSKAEKAAKEMSAKSVKDYAKTKHEGLPKKVDEEVVFEEIYNNLAEQLAYVYENYDEATFQEYVDSLTEEQLEILGLNESWVTGAFKKAGGAIFSDGAEAAAKKAVPKAALPPTAGKPPSPMPKTTPKPDTTPRDASSIGKTTPKPDTTPRDASSIGKTTPKKVDSTPRDASSIGKSTPKAAPKNGMSTKAKVATGAAIAGAAALGGKAAYDKYSAGAGAGRGGAGAGAGRGGAGAGRGGAGAGAGRGGAQRPSSKPSIQQRQKKIGYKTGDPSRYGTWGGAMGTMNEDVYNNLLEEFIYMYENYDEATFQEYVDSLTEEQLEILGLMEEVPAGRGRGLPPNAMSTFKERKPASPAPRVDGMQGRTAPKFNPGSVRPSDAQRADAKRSQQASNYTAAAKARPSSTVMGGGSGVSPTGPSDGGIGTLAASGAKNWKQQQRKMDNPETARRANMASKVTKNRSGSTTTTFKEETDQMTNVYVKESFEQFLRNRFLKG